VNAPMIINMTSLPLLWRTDILVVGSGSAGITAAIAAARTGKHVTLVERYGFLGGTSTAVLDTFYGFYTPGKTSRKVVGGVPDDMLERLFGTNSAIKRPNTFGAGTGITYDPEMLKCVWDDLAVEADVHILLHSFCTEVIMEGERIVGVVVDGKRGLMANPGRRCHRRDRRCRRGVPRRRPDRESRRLKPGSDPYDDIPARER